MCLVPRRPGTSQLNIARTGASRSCTQLFKCANGRSVRQIGRNGRGDGQFDEPVDVAVRKKHLLVADSQNFRIQEFDFDGNFIASVRRGSGAACTESRVADA